MLAVSTYLRRYSQIILFFLPLASIAGAVFIPVQGSAQNFSRATTVETQKAETALVAPKTVIQGRVKPGMAVVVSAPGTGIVEIEALKDGDFIDKGQILARQDDTELVYQLRLLEFQQQETAARIAQIKTDIDFEEQLVSVTEEKLALSGTKLDRAEKLKANQTISPEMFDASKSAYLAAREQLVSRNKALEQLYAQLKLAELTAARIKLQASKMQGDIKQAVITSPATGQIIKRAEMNGMFMREGDQIASIRNDDGFEIEADIPADYIAYLSQDDVIEARRDSIIAAAAENSPIIRLRLRAVLPSQNSRTGTRSVRFIPLSPLNDDTRAENTAVMLEIPTRQPEELILISQDAVIPVGGGHVVFVINNERAERRIVKLGGTEKDRVVILSGLSAGEMVITKGNEVLSDGSAVKLAGAGRSRDGAPDGTKTNTGTVGNRPGQPEAKQLKKSAQ